MKDNKNRVLSILVSSILAAIMLLPSAALAAEAPYDRAASPESQIKPQSVTKYGMLPIYSRDVEEGVYDVRVVSSSSMFRIVSARLTVGGDKLSADITLSGKGYSKLFMGTGAEAAKAEYEEFIGYEEDENGMYTYHIEEVDGLNKAIDCAAFSINKEQWYDRMILFDASSLPQNALKLELPDYDAIEKAMKADGQLSPSGNTVTSDVKPVAVKVDKPDGDYSIEVTLTGGSGKAAVSSPAVMKVRDGRAYAVLVWSSDNYDYMKVGSEKYLNLKAGEGNSTFEIPITKMDKEMNVIGDTTAMGTPHEVDYKLTFYEDSIGDKSKMPQEAAKRVIVIAVIIIVGGGILNHYVQKRRR